MEAVFSIWTKRATFGPGSSYVFLKFPELNVYSCPNPNRNPIARGGLWGQSAPSDSPQTARASPTQPVLGACQVSGSAGARALVGYGRAWQHLEFYFFSPKVESSNKTPSQKRGAPGAPDHTSQIGPSP